MLGNRHGKDCSARRDHRRPESIPNARHADSFRLRLGTEQQGKRMFSRRVSQYVIYFRSPRVCCSSSSETLSKASSFPPAPSRSPSTVRCSARRAAGWRQYRHLGSDSGSPVTSKNRENARFSILLESWKSISPQNPDFRPRIQSQSSSTAVAEFLHRKIRFLILLLDRVLWSKLESGRVPQPEEIFHMIEDQIRLVGRP